MEPAQLLGVEVRALLTLRRKEWLQEWIFWKSAWGSGSVALRIFGIPLHLRSKDLFTAIRDFCGGFLEFDVSNWFKDGVRIKVFVKKEIPDEVLIRYRQVIFPVAVVVEPSPSTSRKYLEGLGKVEGQSIDSRAATNPQKSLHLPKIAAHNSQQHASDLNEKRSCEVEDGVMDPKPIENLDMGFCDLIKSSTTYDHPLPSLEGCLKISVVDLSSSQFPAQKNESSKDMQEPTPNGSMNYDFSGSESDEESDNVPEEMETANLLEEEEEETEVNSKKPNVKDEFLSALEIDIARRAAEFGVAIGMKTNDSEIEAKNAVAWTVKDAFKARTQKAKSSKLEREMNRLNWEGTTERDRR
ncbi:hypothetical protein LINGRAHAP2_LOCUS20444, partial [Linum grandiflorum]